MNSSEDTSFVSSSFTALKPTLRPRLFFLICLLATVWVLFPLLPPLLTGAVLAFLTEPITHWLRSRFNARRGSIKATILSLLTILLIAGLFLLPFGVVVIGTLERISESVRALAGEGSINDLIQNWIQRLRVLPERFSLPVEPGQLSNLLTQAAQTALGWLGNTTAGLVAQAPSAVFFATLSLISWGYCLWKGRFLRVQLIRFLLPWAEERKTLRNTFAAMLKSLVAANILVSLIQAGIIGIFLAFTGVPHAFLWTSLAFFASFIPVVGTLPVTLGGALWCWTVAESLPKTIALIVCAFIAGTADNFLRPFLARGAGALDSFWLFLAILGGLAQFGVAGFILGPLALALCLASATTLRHKLKPNLSETPSCAISENTLQP